MVAGVAAAGLREHVPEVGRQVHRPPARRHRPAPGHARGPVLPRRPRAPARAHQFQRRRRRRAPRVPAEPEEDDGRHDLVQPVLEQQLPPAQLHPRLQLPAEHERLRRVAEAPPSTPPSDAPRARGPFRLPPRRPAHAPRDVHRRVAPGAEAEHLQPAEVPPQSQEGRTARSRRRSDAPRSGGGWASGTSGRGRVEAQRLPGRARPGRKYGPSGAAGDLRLRRRQGPDAAAPRTTQDRAPAVPRRLVAPCRGARGPSGAALRVAEVARVVSAPRARFEAGAGPAAGARVHQPSPPGEEDGRDPRA